MHSRNTSLTVCLLASDVSLVCAVIRPEEAPQSWQSSGKPHRPIAPEEYWEAPPSQTVIQDCQTHVNCGVVQSVVLLRKNLALSLSIRLAGIEVPTI